MEFLDFNYQNQSFKCWHLNIYEQDKFQLCMKKVYKFYNCGPRFVGFLQKKLDQQLL